MRVSRNMIYDLALSQMNSSLSELTRQNMMNASQKKLNKPSDDPAGQAEVLVLRSTIASIGRYDDNISVAKGWLGLQDSQLSQASTTLSTILEKAEQGATGTLTAEERQDIADEVRQYFGNLVGISNSEYTGQSVFAGHKTDSDAYEECLWADSLDADVPDSSVLAVTGSSDDCILVEFTDDGTVGSGGALTYRYSTNGGDSWTDATLASGATTLSLGGVQLTLASGTAVTGPNVDEDGTRFVVRPSARYLGDDDNRVEVINYGATGIDTVAEGSFPGNVQVRIDGDSDLAGPVSYSYSTDGGTTWTAGNTASNGVFELPGGTLKLTSNGSNLLDAGDSFTVKPAMADIDVTIGKGQDVTINSVGSTIFGGLVRDPITGEDSLADVTGNLFDSVGKLIGALEIGDEDAVGDCIDDLKAAQKVLLSGAAQVGAREDRVTYQSASLSAIKASVETHISNVEDADASTLSVDLAKAQYIYQSVLSSQAKVMQLSLLNYLS